MRSLKAGINGVASLIIIGSNKLCYTVIHVNGLAFTVTIECDASLIDSIVI